MNSKIENIIVSVIISVYNEEKYVEVCINSILKQSFINNNIEIIIVDGNSTDNTLNILNNYKNKYDFIKIINNSEKSIQKNLNIAIKNSKGIYIARMDAHSVYNKNYISNCINIIEKNDVKNVGGPMIAVGKSKVQKIIAAAYSSVFALGGGKNHDEKYEGFTDTVYLGFFKKEYLIKIGMYDENLDGSEDDELNFRINLNGGKIYISPKIKSLYYPRENLMDLYKQYFNYGLFKIQFIMKHKKIVRISNFIPTFFVIFIFLFPFAMVLNFLSILFKLILLFYLILIFIFSFLNKKINKFSEKLLLIVVHFTMHFSYGLGFLTGIIKIFKLNKKKN